MFETQVIDDLFTSEFVEKTKKTILAGPWSLVRDMSYNSENHPHYGFNQSYKLPNPGVISPLYEMVCVPILNKIIERLDLKIKDCGAARSFLQLPLADMFRGGKNGTHIDMNVPHLACVYYVVDSDGDTIVYDQTSKDFPPGQYNVDLSVHRQVIPQAGRVVVFDGSRYHCSSQPTNGLRCITNFDLLI